MEKLLPGAMHPRCNGSSHDLLECSTEGAVASVAALGGKLLGGEHTPVDHRPCHRPQDRREIHHRLMQGWSADEDRPGLIREGMMKKFFGFLKKAVYLQCQIPPRFPLE